MQNTVVVTGGVGMGKAEGVLLLSKKMKIEDVGDRMTKRKKEKEKIVTKNVKRPESARLI